MHPARHRRHRRPSFKLPLAGALLLVIAGAAVFVYGMNGGGRVPSPGATLIPGSVSTAQPTPVGDTATALARSSPVRIQIPTLKVSAPVMELGKNRDGTIQVPPLNEHNLTGWYRYGPTPGQRGSSVILGHVDSYKGISVFFYVKTLRKGDPIAVTLSDGAVADFTVDGVQKVSKGTFPTQAIYGHLRYPGLRLITCGGPFDYKTRNYLDNIIVYAHLTASTPA
jgi:sortase (surface protein transpeptidase)